MDGDSVDTLRGAGLERRGWWVVIDVGVITDVDEPGVSEGWWRTGHLRWGAGTVSVMLSGKGRVVVREVL